MGGLPRAAGAPVTAGVFPRGARVTLSGLSPVFTDPPLILRCPGSSVLGAFAGCVPRPQVARLPGWADIQDPVWQHPPVVRAGERQGWQLPSYLGLDSPTECRGSAAPFREMDGRSPFTVEMQRWRNWGDWIWPPQGLWHLVL